MPTEPVNLETFATASERERLNSLNEKFASVFNGKKAEFFCRAPGRVNLIGEHVDYCGYGVLPMAVSQDILMAVAKNEEKKIRLVNKNEKYEPFEVLVDCIEISQSQPKWFHYFLCGFKGVMERQEASKSTHRGGMDVVVDGRVPSCAGLSSSSALVCAAALATMTCYLTPDAFSKLELAEMCQHCEKYIGTEGGGMDQSIAFLAHEGKAKYVEFNPLRVGDVPLPAGVTFIIANSCVQLNKAATCHFNSRVAECRLAAQVLASKEGLAWRDVKKLVDVQEALKKDLEGCCELVRKHLDQDVYSKQQVCDLLKVSEQELNTVSLGPKTYHVEEFKLKQRALHVYSESQRVLQFKAVCERLTMGGGEQKGDGGEGDVRGSLEELGALMNQSHQSCKDDYECSCEELDALVHFARESGALGSRLTGAGWGGCCVIMVSQAHTQALLSSLETYYARKGLSSLKEVFFATVPSKGASIIQS